MNRKVKDRLFRYIFSKDKEALLELYNALHKTSYTNPDDLEIVTAVSYTHRTRSVLLSRWDDTSISGYNIYDLNGKVIGYYERARENFRRLKEFLAINGLECEFKSYTLSLIHI